MNKIDAPHKHQFSILCEPWKKPESTHQFATIDNHTEKEKHSARNYKENQNTNSQIIQSKFKRK
jgi:hypothetical protein